MNVTELKGIGPKKAVILEKMGVYTTEDLLHWFPRTYQDRCSVVPIADLEPGKPALTYGTVTAVRQFSGRRQMLLASILVEDETSAKLEVMFFHAYYVTRHLKQGTSYYFFGEPRVQGGRIRMIHPEFSRTCSEKGLVPVYPLAEGLHQIEMRKWQHQAISGMADPAEVLPNEIRLRYGLCSSGQALSWIHFPQDAAQLERARYRMSFEELFVLQTGLLLFKQHSEKGICMDARGAEQEFAASLPFDLTGAQIKVAEEVTTDMASHKRMNRLIQGDVGSGKTAIAEMALYKAVKSGYQGVLMAPTDLLARQHYRELQTVFRPFCLSVGYLSGHMTVKEKTAQLQRLADGETQVIVGTHALLQPDVVFSRLGLVITDEQHRFGVHQRMLLQEKGQDPDLLVMTATPIPRTMAMVLYGDLDVSVIDELPPGRTPVRTKAVTRKARRQVYEFVAGQLAEGRQAYVVTPLIEESEALEAAGAEEIKEELRRFFPDRRVALVHGEMKQEEKDAVMEDFRCGAVDVLVATVVIEVGIHVPNASVMVIENAERFGLAQLHQLRGRVGRGSAASYCLLICGDHCTETALQRARAMTESSDGFEIAERDLELRGPGEVLGTRQHGIPDMHFADLIRHRDLLAACRKEVMMLLAEDPGLQKHQELRDRVTAVFGRGGIQT